MTVQQLLDKRANVHEQMKDFQKRAKAENRPMNDDELKQWDGWESEHSALTATIERQKKFEAMEAADSVTVDAPSYETTTTAPKDWKQRYAEVLKKFTVRGASGLTPAELGVMHNPLGEQRGTSSQIAGTTTLGGYTIPTGFLPELEKTMLYYADLMGVCKVIYTDSGNNLPMPTANDTGTSAILTAESANMTVADVTFGQFSLDAYSFTSLVKFSAQLLQDSAFDMVAVLTEMFGERFGRAMTTYCTTGSGSSQPNGLVTASALGKTAASTTVWTRSELLDLIHSVDRAYRNSPSARLMFHDTTLKKIAQLEIGTGDARPLWQPSIIAGQPDKVEGYEYVVNNAMSATYTAANKLILFGDFSKYYIRIVKGLEIKTLSELFALNNEVGLAGFQRWDADLTNSAAMKHLILAP